ncbi:uncharacterized protein LOC115772991 [Archocentrus centrarchus]|uniref:uncharacterized protein LOC115772991 n=1 Tax=Archocentrus centrarchus TaxID=63155 RepID=UPI0011E9C2A8|nr:uncharacterized protein LOC115772991 [Archocentrus centrarchus]
MKVLRCFLMGVLLAAGNSVAVDVNWLTGIVKAIRKEYRLKGQFCVAAAIPHRQDSNTLAGDVLHNVRFYEGMEEEAKGGQVFVGSRVILAAPAGPVHAEYSVLENLPKLNKYKDDFLLIYSYLSPCSKCTDRNDKHNILRQIDKNIQNWSDGAFVFTNVYDKPKDGFTVPREVLRSSLKELAFSMGGLQYIFRCANIPDLECHSCSVHNKISEFCIDNNAKPHQAGSSGSWRQRSRSKSRDSRIRNRGGGSSRRRGIHKSQSERNISESRRRSISRSESRGNRRRSRSESRRRSISRSG